MKTTVILIRHTDTGMRGRYFLGRKDIPLTEKGTGQARELAVKMKGMKIDRIYSSCLKRAIRTAEEIAKAKGMKVEHREEFNEIDFGVMDGLMDYEVEEKYPGMVEQRERDPWSFRPPEGESKSDAEKRVMPAFRKLFVENPGKTVIMVMHGSLMGVIFRSVTGKFIRDTGNYVGFGARMYFEKEGETIRFTRIENDTGLETAFKGDDRYRK